MPVTCAWKAVAITSYSTSKALARRRPSDSEAVTTTVTLDFATLYSSARASTDAEDTCSSATSPVKLKEPLMLVVGPAVWVEAVLDTWVALVDVNVAEAVAPVLEVPVPVSVLVADVPDEDVTVLRVVPDVTEPVVLDMVEAVVVALVVDDALELMLVVVLKDPVVAVALVKEVSVVSVGHDPVVAVRVTLDVAVFVAVTDVDDVALTVAVVADVAVSVSVDVAVTGSSSGSKTASTLYTVELPDQYTDTSSWNALAPSVPLE